MGSVFSPFKYNFYNETRYAADTQSGLFLNGECLLNLKLLILVLKSLIIAIEYFRDAHLAASAIFEIRALF